jgi:hypothetical protein
MDLKETGKCRRIGFGFFIIDWLEARLQELEICLTT